MSAPACLVAKGGTLEDGMMGRAEMGGDGCGVALRWWFSGDEMSQA